MTDVVQIVLDTLHENSNICKGADICEARVAIEPLIRVIEQLRVTINVNNDDNARVESLLREEITRLEERYYKLCERIQSIGHDLDALGAGVDRERDQ